LPLAPGVKANSIIAIDGNEQTPNGNDGVVEYKSAHQEGAESEYIVRSGGASPDYRGSEEDPFGASEISFNVAFIITMGLKLRFRQFFADRSTLCPFHSLKCYCKKGGIPMRSLFNTVIIIFLSVVLSSCIHYVPFTSNLKERYSLTNDDIKNIQFYLSNPLRLSREVTTIDSKKVAEGHTLKSVKGKLIEEVNFSDKLPGIAMNGTGDTLDVSFEAGKWLTFVCDKDDWANRYGAYCYLKEQQTVPSSI